MRETCKPPLLPVQDTAMLQKRTQGAYQRHPFPLRYIEKRQIVFQKKMLLTRGNQQGNVFWTGGGHLLHTNVFWIQFVVRRSRVGSVPQTLLEVRRKSGQLVGGVHKNPKPQDLCTSANGNKEACETTTETHDGRCVCLRCIRVPRREHAHTMRSIGPGGAGSGSPCRRRGRRRREEGRGDPFPAGLVLVSQQPCPDIGIQSALPVIFH